MSRYWGGFYYPPANPKNVKDGVKLQSNKIGATWWSKRWISLLDSFGWSNRLGRGRKYAKRGQVIDFKIEPGVVKAKVQGTTSRPYSITIKVNKFSDKEWQKAIKAMSSQAIFAAKLLSGEMPQNIEEAFAKSKISLFPEKEKDFKANCSCPDWANPCKHIAAVHYVLADEFDRDPFMIFRMRGRSKQEIIDNISKQWAKSSVKAKPVSRTPPPKKKVKPVRGLPANEVKKVAPLEKCIHKFWKADDKTPPLKGIGGSIPVDKLRTLRLNIQPPEVPISLIRRLGSPPFWHGLPEFHKEMEKIYKIVTKKAIEVAYESEPTPP